MTNGVSSIMKYFIAAALLLSCCFVSCENSQEEIDKWTRNKVMQEEATNVESYMSQGGVMKARLVAPLMLRVMTDTQYVEFPKKLHVDFYDDSTKIETKLDAKYGKYFETLNKVYLRDSVVVITVKGDTLRCHDLWWDQNKEIFYTDSVATYKSPGNDLTGGKGMEATQDLKTVRFKSPIGTWQINDSGFAE
ncbi:LPS export ABC transporter periplasmic protein LptC [Terrimonas pollutisoli]|uniref:LPS export ABC transporter periplasmic protein LptC n=1 Tax=Terrimonas pollutisoli TaxID=3034147 RepID=UPI0023EB1902|nr:LPS export ABC transporter periplasmic protein LptC [Terrimonas sp. H1YJ31]